MNSEHPAPVLDETLTKVLVLGLDNRPSCILSVVRGSHSPHLRSRRRCGLLASRSCVQCHLVSQDTKGSRFGMKLNDTTNLGHLNKRTLLLHLGASVYLSSRMQAIPRPRKLQLTLIITTQRKNEHRTPIRHMHDISQLQKLAAW